MWQVAEEHWKHRICRQMMMLAAQHSLLGVDDVDELWLERGPSHEEPVNIRLSAELLAVVSSHRP